MPSEPDALANEGWINNRWRPACAWLFIVIVSYDLLLAPLIMQFIFALGNKPYQEWHPNTMLAGGMFYMAFGAIIGVSVWNRTQEKMAIYSASAGPFGSTTTEKTTERSSSTVAPAADTTQTSPKAD